MEQVLTWLLLALVFAGRASAQGSDTERALTLINLARANAGLMPLAQSAPLTAAAQLHAEDMARHGVGIGHVGSDGTTPASRMLGAGYHAYSWGPFVGENWAAFQTIEASVTAWLGDAPHRKNVLRPEYREIGIGVARAVGGYPIVVADFGSQPNVLPVSMNGNGATVSLTLTNEEAAPGGDGPGVLGRAVLVAISTHADLSQARTLPFSNAIQFSSPDGRSISALYVRFYDSQGRTTTSAALLSNTVITPAAVVTNTPIPPPAPTKTATPRPTPTHILRAPTETPIATFTNTPTASPTSSPTPTTTATLHLRQPIAMSAPSSGGMDAAAAGALLSPLALALFAAAGTIVLFAVGLAWWMWQSPSSGRLFK